MNTKKIILVALSMLILTPVCAQEYYTKDDVTIGWKFWDDQYSWDWLIGNGKPLTLSCAPSMNGGGTSFTYPSEIVATLVKENKFLVISFSKELGIRLRTEKVTRTFNQLFSTIDYVQEQMWYELDFEHIVYDEIFNRVMIPCGRDYNGYNNAICVDFNTSSAVSEMDFDNEGKLSYYDLSGKAVELDNSKGNVIIKKSGDKTVKVINK
jgi:hypothetical protein